MAVELIPTIFERSFDGMGRIRSVKKRFTQGYEGIGSGEGEATEMIDGVSCAIIDGIFYRKVDTRYWKDIPSDAFPCSWKYANKDTYTFYWIPIKSNVKGDWRFIQALENSPWISITENALYEAVGKDFRDNPYELDDNFLERAGRRKLKDCPRTYEGIFDYLRKHELEGIVWWKDGMPWGKIRRKDFGLTWPPIRYGDE